MIRNISTSASAPLSKVPEVTLGFWLIKVLATTLGETGGDAFSMSMGLGYLVGSAIFGSLFAVAVCAQIRAKDFHAGLYWAALIASTMLGTTLADFADRSLGIGYPGGSILLLACVLFTLFAWHRSLGSVAVETVVDTRSQLFYWLTIVFSQTLGTALGDWTAATADLSYVGGMFVFGALLLVIAALYLWSSVSRTLLFWAAFVLTRPLGAVAGDFLDKPLAQGGLDLSRFAASAVLLATIAFALHAWPQRAAQRPH